MSFYLAIPVIGMILLASARHLLVFVIAFVSAALGLISAFFTPRQKLRENPSESKPSVAGED